MKVSLQALQSFSGPDGTYTKGDIFDAVADRATFLVDGGYASRTVVVAPAADRLAEVQAPALKK